MRKPLDVVKLNLELENYEVITANNGRKALSLYQEQKFDLILLDLMLPEMDGFQICNQIRQTDQLTPIMMLTAMNTAPDRVSGLKAGANDYLTKPFSLEELVLRVQKLINRNSSFQNKEFEFFEFGNHYVNFSTYEAKGNKGIFNLTRSESIMLKLFFKYKNKVLPRQKIIQAIWGYDTYPSTRTIDNFILNFRKYFEENTRKPEWFQSVRGVGYKFVTQ